LKHTVTNYHSNRITISYHINTVRRENYSRRFFSQLMILGVRCSTVSSASGHISQRTQFCLKVISQRTQALSTTKHNCGDRSLLDLNVQFPLFSMILTKIIPWRQMRPTKVQSIAINPSIKKETSVC